MSSTKEVSVAYTLTSVQSGKKMEDITEEEPAIFVLGKNQLLPDFENKLRTLNPGDSFDFTISAENAYGPSDPYAIFDVPLDTFEEKGKIDEEFFIPQSELPQWKYLKGAKSEERVSAGGYVYKYAEGSMVFPDDINKPSRTIITSEGGKSPSRFRHAIQTKNGLRRLTPLELERLNMFPDNHTKLEGVTDAKRAFFMGNALVVGIVEKLGKELSERINVVVNQEQFA